MNYKLKISYYRKIKGISQKELAKNVEISQGYLSEIERHKKALTINLLYRIAMSLEVCPCDLLSCELIECRVCSYNEGETT